MLMPLAAFLISACALPLALMAQGETTSAIVGFGHRSGRRSDPGRYRDRHQSREWPETIREDGRLRTF